MTSGYPDWRPPGLGATGRQLATVFGGAAPYDVIAAPGAGFRIVLLTLLMWSNTLGADCIMSEVTPANVIVRTVWRGRVVANGSQNMFWDGLPLAEGNKVRVTTQDAGFFGLLLIYTVEAV